jgi:hypothetical protein
LQDRLSFMRFAGLALHQVVPDAKTIWLYREQLKQAGAIEELFRRFDEVLAAKGLLAMGGQIIDATIIAAPRQKLTSDEKATIRDGGTPEGGPVPSGHRRTGMPVGRSSVAEPSPDPKVRSARPSRSRCPSSATRAISASTGGTG